MIPIYSVIKCIDYMTENYFLEKTNFILSVKYRETPSKIFDLLECLIIVIIESIDSYAAIYLTWNLHPYFSKRAEHR